MGEIPECNGIRNNAVIAALEGEIRNRNSSLFVTTYSCEEENNRCQQ